MSQTITQFAVAVTLIRDEELYTISCDSLRIYSQSESTEQVIEDFQTCINILLNKWEKEGTIDARLRALGLIEEAEMIKPVEGHKTQLELPRIPSNLELGVRTLLGGSLATC